MTIREGRNGDKGMIGAKDKQEEDEEFLQNRIIFLHLLSLQMQCT